jgi:glyoxylase-like metal-dependent hydrolase (beta-lactamase superfamily II)
MKMHILSGGRVRIRKSIYLPDADRSETIELPVPCVLLRHPKGNVLFDTGCHPSVAENAEARWGSIAKLMVPIMQPGDNVIAGLAAIGIAPGDIDVVVCSHLHPDHTPPAPRARLSRSTAAAPICSPPIQSVCARPWIRASCRATPGTPTRW